MAPYLQAIVHLLVYAGDEDKALARIGEGRAGKTEAMREFITNSKYVWPPLTQQP